MKTIFIYSLAMSVTRMESRGSGESARPGSNPGPDIISRLSLLLVLVLALRVFLRVFLRVLRFSSLHKNSSGRTSRRWRSSPFSCSRPPNVNTWTLPATAQSAHGLIPSGAISLTCPFQESISEHLKMRCSHSHRQDKEIQSELLLQRMPSASLNLRQTGDHLFVFTTRLSTEDVARSLKTCLVSSLSPPVTKTKSAIPWPQRLQCRESFLFRCQLIPDTFERVVTESRRRGSLQIKPSAVYD